MRPAKALIRCTLLCLLLQSGVALAQVIDARDTGNSIGVGALWSTEPYRGVDSEAWIFPTFTWQRGRFFVRETGLGFQVAGDENWSLDAFAELRFDGYDADDSDFLEGMDDRDDSLDAGFAVVRRLPTLGKFAFSIAGDTLDRHGGYQADVTWSKRTRFGIPAVRVAYYSSSLADYYFGVEPNEARPGRPAYAPGAGVLFNANYSLGGPINDRWVWVANVSADFYPSDIRNSPIVEDSQRIAVFAGASYHFR